MYVRVYAPDGQPFDVTRERADKLLLEQGWTQSPTVSAAKEALEQLAEMDAPALDDEGNDFLSELPFVPSESDTYFYTPEMQIEDAKPKRRARKKAADAEASED